MWYSGVGNVFCVGQESLMEVAITLSLSSHLLNKKKANVIFKKRLLLKEIIFKKKLLLDDSAK